MAKIVQDNITISLSKIAKDDADDNQNLLTDEQKSMLEEVISELVDDGVIVEVK